MPPSGIEHGPIDFDCNPSVADILRRTEDEDNVLAIGDGKQRVQDIIPHDSVRYWKAAAEGDGEC